ncbi:MAG: permease-like cell division protein FtsX [Firmicutes bacterium]|nr:permease-like cell division protein FtsX [Bacillota bacterium]
MKLSSFRYIAPQCFKSMRNNGWMTAAAIITITISLFLCAFFWLLLLNINANVTDVEKDVRVLAYVDFDVVPAERKEIEQELKWIAGVADVSFVPKEQGIHTLEERYGDSDLVESLGGVNPLPDMFSITAIDTNQVSAIAEAVSQIEGIYEVQYGEGTVEKLLSLTDGLRKFGYVIMGLLALCAVVLIAMATRLTVQTRKKEIMVMKWVGATDAFIRWPFILEGMILGLVGAVLALGLLLFLYSRAALYVSINIGFLNILPLSAVWAPATGFTLAAGFLLGLIGSMFPLARFLDV